MAVVLLRGEGLAFCCTDRKRSWRPPTLPSDCRSSTTRVPSRVRRALNVESGLNDGISTPFVTLFVAIAATETFGGGGRWLATALSEIILALVAGIAVGIAGGWLLVQGPAAQTQLRRRGTDGRARPGAGRFILARWRSMATDSSQHSWPASHFVASHPIN